MDNIDKVATQKLISLLEKSLGRRLTDLEYKVFKLPRSFMAYEMIIETINEMKSSTELEKYVRQIANDEYKNT